MKRKICPKCDRSSYSTGSGYLWKCPYPDCEADLTNEPEQEVQEQATMNGMGAIE